jgi:hypothetical protein
MANGGGDHPSASTIGGMGTGRRALTRAAVMAGTLTWMLAAAAPAQMPDLPPLRGTPAPAAPANPAQFTFIVVGDDRPATETATPTPTITQIFQEVAAAKPAFLAILGDTVYGKDDKNQPLVAQEYQEFLALADATGLAVYNAPGNHEMSDKHNHPSATMEAWYRQGTGSLPYGAFTYGNSRFIALNTEDLPGQGCAGAAELSGKKTFAGDLSAAQLGLLEKELAADASFTNVFVLMHRPIYGSGPRLDRGCRDRLKKLFKPHSNVRYVLASHEHLFYQPTKTDPPGTYLVSGGGGAPLAKGGYFHYLVFTVNGDQVTFQIVRPAAGTTPGAATGTAPAATTTGSPSNAPTGTSPTATTTGSLSGAATGTSPATTTTGSPSSTATGTSPGAATGCPSGTATSSARW